MGHLNSFISSTMMFRACLVLVAVALCSTEASYGYGGSGKAYIIPGTEPRAMPGIYKQEYMQPVYITSYPAHHDQHASPVQYVTVASTSVNHHAPALSGHGYAAAPAVHAPALSGHGYSAAPAVSYGHTVAPVVSYDNTAAHVSHRHTVAPVVSHDNTAAYVSHGYNVAPAISHSYSPVYQLVRSAPIKFTPSHEHVTIPSHGRTTHGSILSHGH